MRILITHEVFPPDYQAGGEKIILELAKGLKHRGHQVKVLTTGDPKITEFQGITTTRLPINRYLMNLALPWIYKHAKDVDIIQTNNYNACFPSFVAGRLLRKPVICINTGLIGPGPTWRYVRGPIWGFISRQVEKFQLSHRYDRIVFYSNFAKERGLKINIPEEICEIISPGVEYEKFSKVEKKEPFVLFVGKGVKRKGVEYLVETARQLPDIRFKVAGAGAEDDYVKTLHAPENVEFLGFITGESLYSLFRRALVFCLPSLSETFGLVILEAMAAGCAVVSSVPLDYEGIRIKPGDVSDLKQAISYLITTPDIALKAGNRNREKAKEFTWENYAGNFERLYQEVLSQRQKAKQEFECESV